MMYNQNIAKCCILATPIVLHNFIYACILLKYKGIIDMSIIPNILAYHCNDEDRCSKFVSEDYLIGSNDDGIWPGDGMYFWDNVSNAYFWRNEKIRKDSSKRYVIVCANLILINLLDLTDLETCRYIGHIWRIYCDTIKRDYSETLGKKINLLFEEFPDFQKYHIIKVYGKYNQTPQNNLFTYDLSSFKCEPTLAVKCIYSVRKSECICNRSFYRED
jgi:hypothetical protein